MLSPEETTALLLSERLALTAYLATVTRDYQMAEDVYQDVCVKAIVRHEPFESQAHLRNWARASGRNRAVDILRVRDGRYEGLSEDLLSALADAWPCVPADGWGRRREALARCMAELTPNGREILKLRYFEGRSGRDVAELLGRKVETVYQALARIHKALGECIRLRLAAEGDG